MPVSPPSSRSWPAWTTPPTATRLLAPGASVGLLQQEPPLDEDKTVRENVEDAVAEMRGWLARFEEVSAAMGEPDADFDQLLTEQGDLMEKIEHGERLGTRLAGSSRRWTRCAARPATSR